MVLQSVKESNYLKAKTLTMTMGLYWRQIPEKITREGTVEMWRVSGTKDQLFVLNTTHNKKNFFCLSAIIFLRLDGFISFPFVRSGPGWGFAMITRLGWWFPAPCWVRRGCVRCWCTRSWDSDIANICYDKHLTDAAPGQGSQMFDFSK